MRLVVLSVSAALCGAVATGQTVVDSMCLGYTGTVTRYSTLADAQSGMNAVASASLGTASRDLYVTFSQVAGANAMQIGTGWFLTTTGVGYGDGNPNNTNTGFVQLVDETLGSVSSASAAWDDSLTSFSFQLNGVNALSTNGVGGYNTRLWNTTNAKGQGGLFLNYDLTLAATVNTAAAWDPASGMFLSSADPTAVKGYFRGLFLNTSPVTAYNGYYTFDFTLNLDSWAAENAREFDATTLTANAYRPTTFGAAIPEPSAGAVCVGLGALLVVAWRRRRWRAPRVI
ncbi:MAG: hypothetical protein QM691_00665 [Opitutaceae bacterium]